MENSKVSCCGSSMRVSGLRVATLISIMLWLALIELAYGPFDPVDIFHSSIELIRSLKNG